MAYLHLTLARSKDQGQGRADFDNEYLRNGVGCEKYHYCHQIGCYVLSFNLHAYIRP